MGWVVLILCVCLVGGACGRINDLAVHDDERFVFSVETFGFKEGGVAELEVAGFDVQSSTSSGFLLLETTSESTVVQSIEDILETHTCLLGGSARDGLPPSTHILNMCDKEGECKVTGTAKWIISEPGLYDLMYMNCADTPSTTFKLTATLYNPGHDYLGAGEDALPTMYMVMSAVFLGMLVVWVLHCRKHPDKVHKVHHLMTVLVLFKVLSLFFEGVRYHSIRTLGHPSGWTVLYYIATFMRGMLLFTVVILIGTGWSLVKPFLSDKERKIMLLVVPLQVLSNVALIVVYESQPGSVAFGTWGDLLHLLDIVCCCAVLFPIIWSINHLRAAAGADGKAADTLQRLMQFRSFYVYTVAYVYFTRIIVYLMGVTVGYEMLWVAPLFNEVAACLYYSAVGWRFRPESDNPYFRVRTSDDESDEEFGLESDSDSSSGGGPGGDTLLEGRNSRGVASVGVGNTDGVVVKVATD